MKWNLLFLSLVLTISCYGQPQDSVVCLPKSDIVTLANKIRLLRDSLNYRGAIIFAQDTLIDSQKKLISAQKDQTKVANDMVLNLKEENKVLNDTVKLLQPKWYDNKWLWFSGGSVFVTAIILLSK
jgi:hypothetical protein